MRVRLAHVVEVLCRPAQPRPGEGELVVAHRLDEGAEVLQHRVRVDLHGRLDEALSPQAVDEGQRVAVEGVRDELAHGRRQAAG